MKCPRCGNEMVLDTHRKYPLNMCYECGYMEGRPIGDTTSKTNYEHMKNLNFNEMVVFLSKGLGLEESVVSNWLNDPLKGDKNSAPVQTASARFFMFFSPCFGIVEIYERGINRLLAQHGGHVGAHLAAHVASGYRAAVHQILLHPDEVYLPLARLIVEYSL